MNILIPHAWLLEHLDTQASPQEIQKNLSLCGPSVERIYDESSDSVYDIEVTTNRVDSMSVRGIAREAAVILPQFGIDASLKKLTVPTELKPSDHTLPLPNIIDQLQNGLCKRTLGIVLTNVQHTATPDYMAERLTQTEQTVHDAVIDITNYVTHELGYPCHAFDYDKIMALGGEIIITEAQAGDIFVTLDGAEYKAVGGEIVFKNSKGEIIDLPAIMGTLNTSVSSTTRNVLLWIESLDAKKVRFGSMSHAIRTTAAQLNEKNVDPELGLDVMKRCVELYQTICHAEIASELHDNFPGKRTIQPVTISLQQIENYLGITLPPERIVSILETLECQVSGGDELIVTPPSFRPDLAIPADIIEEIARIYGYHNLPSKIMDTAIPLTKPDDINFHVEFTIKQFLATLGWQEVFTYSMVSAQLAEHSGYSLNQHHKLANPLTDDKVYLRRSLLPSLEELTRQNANRTDVSVFEMASLYHPQSGELPLQPYHLSLVSTQNYRTVRGVVEALLEHFFVKNVTITPVDDGHSVFAQVASIKATDTHNSELIEVGVIGILKSGHVAVDLPLTALRRVLNSHPTYQPLSKTAAISEDLTFTLPVKTAVGDVMNSIQAVSPLISSVQFKDVYGQNMTFGLTFLDPSRNISAEEVQPIRAQVVSTISDQYQGQLVGTV